MNDQSKPHRNAGEVMPEGISALLAEVGPLDGRDLFLDIERDRQRSRSSCAGDDCVPSDWN